MREAEREMHVLRRSPAAPHLTADEQRVLTAFLERRLPAGQLQAELLRARREQEVLRALATSK